jgi:integrase/recombinase XerD
MALFKRVYYKKDPVTGRRKKCRYAKWYGQFRDLAGKRHRVPLATDKIAAAQMLADLVKQSERGLAGVSDPFAEHTWRPLTEHIDDFEKSTKANGTTEKHAKLVANRLRAVVAGCGFTFIRDINADKISQWLEAQRAASPRFGNTTSNHHMRAVAMFCYWASSPKRGNRCAVNPYGKAPVLNEDVDVRRQRRALTDDEIAWLVASTETGPVIGEISGEDRAMLYRLALTTGLRASELKSLSPESFDLAGSLPTVTVEARHSKHRREDVLPLHSDIVPRLRTWLAKRVGGLLDAPAILSLKGAPAGSGERLWTGSAMKERRYAETVRRDLKLARKCWIEASADDNERKAREASEFLCYLTREGYADFHSFRHTMITRTMDSGMKAHHAQAMARHANIKQTLKYTHVRRVEVAQSLQLVPSLPSQPVVSAKSAAVG